MCGRAYQLFGIEELDIRFGRTAKQDFAREIKPNYNLAPTQLSPVVLIRNGEKQLDLFRWGLVPKWASDLKSAAKYSLINAKAEDIETKRSYAEPFKRRRCIVPLSGFFEWLKGEGKTKRPFAISLKDEAIMGAAGVWENWVDRATGEIVDSFSIITTSANPFMEKIHDRMPMILNRDDEQQWLDPKNENIGQLKALLKPFPSEKMQAYEISTRVNSPRENVKDILDPVAFEKS